MNSEHALIVDDSKTAQHRLKRMLEKFDLDIDIVSSAEEALAHLSYNHPAVIFLDHHMTGMSGMDALKTIKANPNTALIPVVMYTSEKDDLFVTQARALGALDILSKSTMQPSNLERVLESLNIYPRAPEENESREKPVVVAPKPTPGQTPPVSDLQQVRSQVGRLFEIHIAEVRSQINTSTQFIVKRLSTVIESRPIRDGGNDDVFLSAGRISDAEAGRKSAFISNLLLVAVLIGMGIFLYQILQTQEALQQVAKTVQESSDAGKADTHAIADSVSQLVNDKKAEVNQESNSTLLRAVGVVQNADFQFNYGESPFNPQQLANLTNVVSILAQAGYRGPIVVDLNFGNVCLEPGTAANTWRLARSEMPATSCKMLKDLSPKFAIADYMTPAYQTFEQTLPPIQDGRVSIRLTSSGLTYPRTEYPIVRTSTTAGEWNNAALKNNRISIQFPS
jgi:CheY-like chemotaxis protein